MVAVNDLRCRVVAHYKEHGSHSVYLAVLYYHS